MLEPQKSESIFTTHICGTLRYYFSLFQQFIFTLNKHLLMTLSLYQVITLLEGRVILQLHRFQNCRVWMDKMPQF